MPLLLLIKYHIFFSCPAFSFVSERSSPSHVTSSVTFWKQPSWAFYIEHYDPSWMNFSEERKVQVYFLKMWLFSCFHIHCLCSIISLWSTNLSSCPFTPLFSAWSTPLWNPNTKFPISASDWEFIVGYWLLELNNIHFLLTFFNLFFFFFQSPET